MKQLLLMLTTIWMAALLVPLTWAEAPRPRTLLISGQGSECPPGRWPDWQHEFHDERLIATLQDLLDITRTDDLTALSRDNLRRYQLVINNSLLRCPNQTQMQALLEFVAAGNSLLALNNGLISFLNTSEYTALIGARFLGWDHNESFMVDPFDAWYGFDYNDQTQHPITRGLQHFEVKGHLYLMEMNTQAVEVIARAQHHPLLWLRHHGEGQVMGFALGHNVPIDKNLGYRALLRNSVRWLTGYPIVEPLAEVHLPADVDSTFTLLLNKTSHSPDGKPLQYRLAENPDADLVKANLTSDGQLRLRPAGNRPGRMELLIEASGQRTLTTPRYLGITLHPSGQGNLAGYSTTHITTSANEYRKMYSDPARLTDGNPQSRWSSDYRDDNWVRLDFGREYVINRVKLLWESAYGKRYRLQASDDGENWRDLTRQSDGKGGLDEFTFEPVSTRYLRLLGEERATEWGYSLYEFEVYGPAEE